MVQYICNIQGSVGFCVRSVVQYMFKFLGFFQHMLKHRYVPWSHGKTVYKGKEDTGKVVSS